MTSGTNMPFENVVHRTSSRPFSLHHTIVEAGEVCALYPHCHSEAEFFFLEEGRLDFHVENRVYALQSGEGIFIPPNLIHNADNLTKASGHCCHRALVFSVDMLEKSLPAYCRPYFTPLRLKRLDCIYPITRNTPQNTRLFELLPVLFSFEDLPLEQYELSLTGTLLACWQELYNLCFSALAISSPHGAAHLEIQNCLDFMQDHFSEPLSLADLAASAGFSQGYFCHSFKACTGYAPFAYLNRLRIVKSCELLAQTDKKITEIASLCGFNNISYFNRTFCKVMNTTPSGYRSAFLTVPPC